MGFGATKLMQRIQSRVSVIICTLACLSGAVGVRGAELPSERTAAQQKKFVKKNPAVTEWFRKYDQIRRDAEETTKDKYQSLFLGEGKPDRNNAALAVRMFNKYNIALAAIKQLQPTPETRELQKGYTEYFKSARQLFADFLKAQKVVPFNNKPLLPAKNRLVALDKTNKKLDEQLRKQYGIPRHKHI